jgi:uncharacterized protein YjbJ (UPF0337 family)
MNWDRIDGNWRQLKGIFKEHWGKLTDDQLEIIAGKRERLVGVLQESYGVAKDEAERLVKEWEKSEERALAFEQALRRNGNREMV